MTWSIELYLFAFFTYLLSINEFLPKVIGYFSVANSVIFRTVGFWMLVVQLVFGNDPFGLFYYETFGLID